MSEELKPCPFCGSEAEPYQYRVNEFTVRCKRCKADCGGWKDPYKAKYAWNTRPIEDEKYREIEKLKEALKQIDDIAIGEHILGRFEYQFRQIDNIIKSLDKDNDVSANDTKKLHTRKAKKENEADEDDK